MSPRKAKSGKLGGLRQGCSEQGGLSPETRCPPAPDPSHFRQAMSSPSFGVF